LEENNKEKDFIIVIFKVKVESLEKALEVKDREIKKRDKYSNNLLGLLIMRYKD